MVFRVLRCPHCGSENVKEFGQTKAGKKRYKCLNTECPHVSFMGEYTYNACDPKIREQIYFSIVNGSGTRATARLLDISKDTVTNALRRIEEHVWHVNYNYIAQRAENKVDIEIIPVAEAEMDEMWSFYHDKSHQIWLWWAIDHNTGEPLAFCFGTREHKYLDELRELLEPFFDIGVVYADGHSAYKSHITESTVVTGKKNTQKIERKHLSLRTWCSRLVRKGIRFSKDKNMHIIVVGMIINFWFFSHIVWT
jgi:IS1 family transposase/transposase-like protein